MRRLINENVRLYNIYFKKRKITATYVYVADGTSCANDLPNDDLPHLDITAALERDVRRRRSECR